MSIPLFKANQLRYSLLTAENWNDFETVMGKNGAYGGCWCAFDRMRRSIFSKTNAEHHKSLVHSSMAEGRKLGLIAYLDKEPIAWCSVAETASFPGIVFSTSLKPQDTQGVWSLNCMYVRKKWRMSGVTTFLIKSAVEVARNAGASRIEAYPVDARSQTSGAYLYRGVLSTFLSLGFSKTRERAGPSKAAIVSLSLLDRSR